ncbi:MAG: P-loop NTPase [Deltaproteobacteria bacterium]|nr:P-loop NTPase [Deltaproteobacteria bacterium]
MAERGGTRSNTAGGADGVAARVWNPGGPSAARMKLVETPTSKPEPAKTARIVAVAGAKGGVGKSVLASSVAIALAAAGRRVVAIDLDLGAANLHLMTGVKRPAKSLDDFFSSRTASLADCATPTAFPGLRLVAGDGARLGAANPAHQTKMRLIRHLRDLDADVIVCDLGAGTGYNTLDFWLMAGERLVVTTTEPPAILDAYAMIKTSLYRYLLMRLKAQPDRPENFDAIEEYLHGRAEPTIAALSLRGYLAKLREQDGVVAGKMRTWVESFAIEFVLNQSHGEADLALVGRLTDLAAGNLGLTPPSVTRLPREATLPNSIARLVPFVASRPESPYAWAVAELAARIAGLGRNDGARRILAALAVNAGDAAERIRTQIFD